MRFLRRALRFVVLAILLAVCATLFYLLVIMGDTSSPEPIAEPVATAGPMASLPQSPLRFAGSDLYQAEYYFSAPVLTLGGRDWELEEVTVQDTTPEGVGVAVREIRLRYADADGRMVDVSSLTPARCLRALSAKGYVAAIDQDWMLAGTKAVLMRSGSTLHLHIQKDDIVYQIEGDVEIDALRKAAGAAAL